jgi:copper chaperone
MRTSVTVQNLKCHGCANTITKKLNRMKSVSNVIVDSEENTVIVSYVKEEDLDGIKSKLAKLGYPEVGETNSLGEKAKSYVNCAMGRMS